jgi:uncharacterized protein with von Willebrand factor type A (vWA) domain
MERMALLEAEALLEDRERVCLAGYLLMRDSDDKADIKAYVYSRSYPVNDEIEVIRKKAKKWFSQPKVTAFLELWKEKGRIVQESERKEAVIKQQEDEKQLSAIEEIIQRYEQLYKETEDIEEKAKILKMIVDARHKNKDEVKEDGKIAQIYLPLRCIECPLYTKEKNKSF